jgi:hypothetical protein
MAVHGAVARVKLPGDGEANSIAGAVLNRHPGVQHAGQLDDDEDDQNQDGEDKGEFD